jgi:hypothetical protein
LDFALSRIANDDARHLRINRKWKPLLGADMIPLGLWPHILEKAHTSPDTSHGPVGILFYLLRENPDLVRDSRPHILEKAHTSPEACSHGPVGFLLYLLRKKLDLVRPS